MGTVNCIRSIAMGRNRTHLLAGGGIDASNDDGANVVVTKTTFEPAEGGTAITAAFEPAGNGGAGLGLNTSAETATAKPGGWAPGVEKTPTPPPIPLVVKMNGVGYARNCKPS
jgi:hypothetical protein